MHRLVKWLANNPWFIVGSAITSVLSYLDIHRRPLEWILRVLNVTLPEDIKKVVAFLSWLAFLLLIAWLVEKALRRAYREALSVYLSNFSTWVWRDGVGIRTNEFEKLRAQAETSMFVMGIGMTLFSRELNFLAELLNKDLTVRLLMIDPNIFSLNAHTKDKPKSFISNTFFEQYFERPGYTTEVKTSYERLVNFIQNRKLNTERKGQVSLRTYRYLIPLNVTVVDSEKETRAGKMLLEWCFPFTDWRMCADIGVEDNSFDRIKENLEMLWNHSNKVVEDF